VLARQTAIGEELPTSVLEEIRHDELHTQRLKRAGIAPSRGRTGTALDNALAESVISTLKRELIALKGTETPASLTLPGRIHVSARRGRLAVVVARLK
jgi:transposase InsO family protein